MTVQQFVKYNPLDITGQVLDSIYELQDSLYISSTADVRFDMTSFV